MTYAFLIFKSGVMLFVDSVDEEQTREEEDLELLLDCQRPIVTEWIKLQGVVSVLK